jgi:hypothetical protein
MDAFEIKGIIAGFLFIWKLFEKDKRKTERIHNASTVYIAFST